MTWPLNRPTQAAPQKHPPGLDFTDEPAFYLSSKRPDRTPAPLAQGALEPHWVEVIEAATD